METATTLDWVRREPVASNHAGLKVFSNRSFHFQAVLVGHRIYVLGIRDRQTAHWVNSHAIRVLDVVQCKWTRIQTSGELAALSNYAAVLIDDRIVCFGGLTPRRSRPFVDDLYEFSLLLRHWRRVEVKWVGLRRPYAHTAMYLDLFACLIILYEGKNGFLEACAVDTSDYEYFRLNTRGRPPPSRRYHSATSAGSRVFVLGGALIHPMNFSTDFHMLDFSTSVMRPRWESLRPLVIGRRNASIVSCFGRILVLGGHSQGSRGARALVYNLASDEWTSRVAEIRKLPAMSELVYHAIVCAGGQKLYLISSLANENGCFYEVNVSQETKRGGRKVGKCNSISSQESDEICRAL